MKYLSYWSVELVTSAQLSRILNLKILCFFRLSDNYSSSSRRLAQRFSRPSLRLASLLLISLRAVRMGLRSKSTTSSSNFSSMNSSNLTSSLCSPFFFTCSLSACSACRFMLSSLSALLRWKSTRCWALANAP